MTEKETLPNLVEEAEGHWLGIKRVRKDLVQRPYLAIVDVYETVRHGTLYEFYLVVPEDAEVVDLVDRVWVKYNGKCWEVIVRRGDPETPGWAKIKELDCKRFTRAKTLMMELRGETCP